MGAVEQFLRRGIRLELADGDNVRVIGTLNESLRTAIKTQKAQIIDELHWREFETLLAIVGPSYRTRPDEYPVLREVARGDLANALIYYRSEAKRIEANR